MKRKRKLSVGDWVEVRSKEEVLRTLDRNGELDGMPFMPEMFAFCGKKFPVYKRAHKTCDTVVLGRGRRVDQAVHLDTRCDGQAHGGCQATCLFFWKEAWLKPIRDKAADAAEKDSGDIGTGSAAGCTEADVWARTMCSDPVDGKPVYSCQATRLPDATTPLSRWDMRQYFEDYWSGNVSLWRVLCGLVYSIFYHISQAGIGVGPPLEWLYDRLHVVFRGTLFPNKTGSIPEGQPTPTTALDLQPGELVRVKPHEEILKTLNVGRRNKGLGWDAEMVPYCGGTYTVLKRISRIINEKTGKMQEMKNPCIILDSVVCRARYAKCRMFCPRSIYPYWHEIWLERVGGPGGASTGDSVEDSLIQIGGHRNRETQRI